MAARRYYNRRDNYGRWSNGANKGAPKRGNKAPNRYYAAGGKSYTTSRAQFAANQVATRGGARKSGYAAYAERQATLKKAERAQKIKSTVKKAAVVAAVAAGGYVAYKNRGAFKRSGGPNMDWDTTPVSAMGGSEPVTQQGPMVPATGGVPTKPGKMVVPADSAPAVDRTPPGQVPGRSVKRGPRGNLPAKDGNAYRLNGDYQIVNARGKAYASPEAENRFTGFKEVAGEQAPSPLKNRSGKGAGVQDPVAYEGAPVNLIKIRKTSTNLNEIRQRQSTINSALNAKLKKAGLTPGQGVLKSDGTKYSDAERQELGIQIKGAARTALNKQKRAEKAEKNSALDDIVAGKKVESASRAKAFAKEVNKNAVAMPDIDIALIAYDKGKATAEQRRLLKRNDLI